MAASTASVRLVPADLIWQLRRVSLLSRVFEPDLYPITPQSIDAVHNALDLDILFFSNRSATRVSVDFFFVGSSPVPFNCGTGGCASQASCLRSQATGRSYLRIPISSPNKIWTVIEIRFTICSGTQTQKRIIREALEIFVFTFTCPGENLQTCH